MGSGYYLGWQFLLLLPSSIDELMMMRTNSHVDVFRFVGVSPLPRGSLHLLGGQCECRLREWRHFRRSKGRRRGWGWGVSSQPPAGIRVYPLRRRSPLTSVGGDCFVSSLHEFVLPSEPAYAVVYHTQAARVYIFTFKYFFLVSSTFLV